MLKSASKPSTGKAGRKSKAPPPSKESRFLDRREDVEEFAAAARAYVRANTKSRKTALAALRRMGIVTPTGRLTKRYK